MLAFLRSETNFVVRLAHSKFALVLWLDWQGRHAEQKC